MIDEATYGELDRYFHSQMSTEEKSAFASRMNANQDLRAEFQWLNTMLGGMKQQGRSVLKQTIAGAIAGVPFEQVEKYKPAMNKKSFFKKYWWVVTTAVVAIATAIAIYLYTTQRANMESHDENGDAFSEETMIDADAAGTLNADSCDDQALPAGIDSIFKSEGAGRVAVRETVDVRIGNHVYYDIDEENNITRAIAIAENDSINRSRWKKQPAYSGVEDEPYNKDKTRSMGVTTGYKPFPPYTYKLDDDLMLNAPYYSCKGFTWEGMGSDTVYMTTKDGIEYMLLRGQGVKELVPVTGRGEPVNYNPVRK
jgi:hypothetical protein